jgi:hypothetical protein
MSLQTVGMGVTLGLAAAGGYFFGPVGFSAGMMLGSWISSSFQEEDNVIIDSGAQEMPRFNNALRGVTMPVLFGTNRVSSNLVWQNNFQTIRHESQESQGGGGKSGGSGGGKSGGGPSNVTYEYKWDLMYHFGMVSEDFNIFGGWMYAQRLNDSTLNAITQNQGGTANAFFKSDVDRPQTAELSFEEGFFANGYATGDENSAGWSHFESVTGVAHKFPYTSFVGFKALSLGESPHVPQLSFEVGPGGASLEFESNYINHENSTAAGSSKSIGQGACRGDDGRYYIFMEDGSLYRLDDGVRTDTWTAARFNTQWHTYTPLADPDPATYTFTGTFGGATLPGTPYVLLHGRDSGGGSTSNQALLLFKINSDGLMYTVGTYAGNSTGLSTIMSDPVKIGQGGYNGLAVDLESLPVLMTESRLDDSSIYCAFINLVGASRGFRIVNMPTPNQLKVGINDLLGSNSWGLRVGNYDSLVGQYFGIHQSSVARGSFGWFVPFVDSASLFQWSSRFYFYITKGDVAADDANPGAGDASSYVNSTKATYPDGHIAYISLGISSNTPPDLGPLVVVNEDFTKRENNTALVPFSDDLTNRDGTADTDDGYDQAPSVQLITSGGAAGGYIIFFTKKFTGSEDLSPSGTYNKTRMFIYNPMSFRYREYATGEGGTFDTVSDTGMSEGNRYSYNSPTQIMLVDQDESIIYEVRSIGGGTGPLDDDTVISKFGTYVIGGGVDVLPPFIIRSILTSGVFGISLDDSSIDQASYDSALLYCDAEDIRVSTMYNREEGALKVIEMLLALYGGFLIDSGGKIFFGIQDLSNNPVRTIDNDHLVVQEGEAPVTITLPAKQESYNKIKINYIDRDLEYRQNFIEMNDEVDQDLNGIRAREFPGKFVMKEPLAWKLAARTLWSNLYGKDRYSFKLGPKDSDLRPGDVITLVDSFSPNTELNTGVRCRIAAWEETEALMFSVVGVKEVEYINTSTQEVNSSAGSTFNQLYGPVVAMADFRMYELPKEFQGSNPSLFVGYNQLSTIMGARLYISADGVSFAKADDISPYIISGIFKDALPDRQGLFVEENVKLYLMPDTRSTESRSLNGFSPATPTYVQTHALDDVDASGRGLGAGNIYAGSEMLAFEGLNLIGQNEYVVDKLYRGWGGTNIQAHNSGAHWHKHAGGVFTRPYNEDKLGTLIHYKVVPYNFAGVEYPVSSVDAKTYAIDGLYFKPQVQPPIRTFVTSGVTVPASDNLGALEFKHVHSTGTNVDFTWPDAARDKGYGTAGYGSGLYGRFTIDTTSHNYRVEVYSNDLTTVVRCLTVDTGFFTYSRDINSTDFAGWAGDLLVRVTPFNDIGDAPRNQTKRIQLFEQV